MYTYYSMLPSVHSSGVIIFIALVLYFVFGIVAGFVRGEHHKPWGTDKRAEEWHKDVTLFGDPTPWDDDHFR